MMRVDFLEYCLSYESLTQLIQNNYFREQPIFKNPQTEEAKAAFAHLPDNYQ